jgi:single-strand DNA-binding protein
MAAVRTPHRGDQASRDHRNEVTLVGRLPALPENRSMPSGDVVTIFRVVVLRPPGTRRGAGRTPNLDTLDCAAWRPDVRRNVTGWRPGDTVMVTGALRRRFWRGAHGSVSRTEVEVLKAKRVSKA